MAGRVLVFHNNLRDEGRLELVATVRSNAAGRYVVPLTPTPEIDEARARDDGVANFTAYAVTDSGLSQYHFFSAERSADRWSNRRGKLDDFRLDQMDLIATKPLPDPAFAQRLEQSESVRRLSGGKNRAAPRPNAAQNITYQNCYYTLVSTFDRNSPVAELHTWYSDLTGRVWYGKTNKADSHISVGIRADDTVSGFYASGSVYVANSYTSTVETSLTKTGQYGWVQQSSFRYARYRNDWSANWRLLQCWDPNHGGNAPYEIVQPDRWNGTALGAMWNDGRFDGQCLTTYYGKRMSLQSGGYWSRFSENLTGFGYSISVAAGLTADMSSYSGASTKVGFEYWGGQARSTYWLCGNSDFPAYSLRIFAGG